MKRLILRSTLILAMLATSACSIGTSQPDMSAYAYTPSSSSSVSVVIEPGIDAF